ncbi:hypothetical protein DdX_11225 [Ditylenchus destructor]|uniref:Secreted protein n=1 Tax=Ditylenchus destructor TaxID=166010 RepID=A0AAD4MWG1_9BILA|nr:hypothetical protein DdX_11225 [Ditylenchus destructor]
MYSKLIHFVLAFAIIGGIYGAPTSPNPSSETTLPPGAYLNRVGELCYWDRPCFNDPRGLGVTCTETCIAENWTYGICDRGEGRARSARPQEWLATCGGSQTQTQSEFASV